MKSGSGRLVNVRLVMSHVGLCQLQDPGEIKTSTYIYMVREIPMSFPYNQLSTCPVDNILAPCGSYLDPSPTDAHLLLPVQSGQKYLGQHLALPCSYHAPAMEPLLVCCRPSYDTNSIPALVRPTTSSYTRRGPFGHDTHSFCRGSQRIWLPSVGPGNGMETASSPPLLPVPSMNLYPRRWVRYGV